MKRRLRVSQVLRLGRFNWIIEKYKGDEVEVKVYKHGWHRQYRLRAKLRGGRIERIIEDEETEEEE